MPSMIFHILAPLALLLPVAQAVPPPAPDNDPASDLAPDLDEEWQVLPPAQSPALEGGEGRQSPIRRFMMLRLDAEPAEQVRIDQRLIIRIAPRGPGRDPFFAVPQVPEVRQYRERKTGSCLPVQGIRGVEVEDNRLILFMRDRRILAASLEKGCRPRDFYSGFYVERTDDNRICAGRDDVQSRAGVTCAISRLRELVPDD